MQALVTGATGFIGRHLVRGLAGAGHSCRCLVRPTSDRSCLVNIPNLTFVTGDITDPGSLQGITEGIEVVFHLAAEVGQWGVSDKHFVDVNISGTRNLISALYRSHVRRLVYCSTPGVLGFAGPRSDETHPYAPRGIYEKTKCEAEKLVLSMCPEQRLEYVILRPDFVYGPGDVRRLPLYNAIAEGRFWLIGDGNAIWTPTYIDDVVLGFILASTRDKAADGIYHIAGPEQVTVRNFCNVVASVLGSPPPRKGLPKSMALLGAAIMELILPLFRRKPPLTRSMIEFLTTDHGSLWEKAYVDLEYEPRVTLRTGMEQTARWLNRIWPSCH